MTSKMIYTIQQMAEKTGLTAYTLRYYEDIALLEPIARAPNGHRRYSEEDVLRVTFLKRLRKTGMSLEEMKHFIALYREGHASATARRELLEAQRQSVTEQMAELKDIIDFIDYKIGLYQEEEIEHERDTKEHEISSVG